MYYLQPNTCSKFCLIASKSDLPCSATLIYFAKLHEWFYYVILAHFIVLFLLLFCLLNDTPPSGKFTKVIVPIGQS